MPRVPRRAGNPPEEIFGGRGQNPLLFFKGGGIMFLWQRTKV
nr:MAG TPA: hypothetical protein [Caudoviricetes sp.]